MEVYKEIAPQQGFVSNAIKIVVEIVFSIVEFL